MDTCLEQRIALHTRAVPRVSATTPTPIRAPRDMDIIGTPRNWPQAFANPEPDGGTLNGPPVMGKGSPRGKTRLPRQRQDQM